MTRVALVVCALVACSAPRPQPPKIRTAVFNPERKPVLEFAAELGAEFSEFDPEYSGDVIIGVAANLVRRHCFPTNDALANIWLEWFLIEREGDSVVVSIQKEEHVSGARYELRYWPHACVDSFRLLLPKGTRFSGGLNDLMSLMQWGRRTNEASEKRWKRQRLVELQVTQALMAECFRDRSALGTVLWEWHDDHVSVRDVRNGREDNNDGCTRRFRMNYPIDVAGDPMVPDPGFPLTSIGFGDAHGDVATTRKSLGLD
jgi:hypothetical protein